MVVGIARLLSVLGVLVVLCAGRRTGLHRGSRRLRSRPPPGQMLPDVGTPEHNNDNANRQREGQQPGRETAGEPEDAATTRTPSMTSRPARARTVAALKPSRTESTRVRIAPGSTQSAKPPTTVMCAARPGGAALGRSSEGRH